VSIIVHPFAPILGPVCPVGDRFAYAIDPIDAADATFASDIILADKLIGKWVAGTLGGRGWM